MASLHLNFYWGIITTLNYSPIHLALNHPTPCYPHACQVFVNTDTCTALCDVMLPHAGHVQPIVSHAWNARIWLERGFVQG